MAYPLVFYGVVVAEGDTDDDAVSDVKSAIQIRVETFGPEVLDIQSLVLGAYVTDADVPA